MVEPKALVSGDVEYCRKQLRLQMGTYHIECSGRSDEKRARFTGKTDSSGKRTVGLKDDLCIALQMLIYWSEYFIMPRGY